MKIRSSGLWGAGALYSICWAWILFISEPLWDDWTILFRNNDDLGSVPDPRMHIYMLLNALPEPVFFYRVCGFLALFFSGLFFRKILKRMFQLPLDQLNIALILFWILPLNPARVACINFPYLLSLMVFLSGILAFLNSKPVCRYGLAPLLLLYSFMTPSLLVYFYAFLFIYFLYEKRNPLVKMPRLTYSLLLFACFPIVAWTLRYFFFQPRGIYAEYYSIKTEALIYAPWLSLKVLIKNILQYEDLIYTQGLMVWIAGLCLVLLPFGLKTKMSALPNPHLWVMSGLFLLLAGLFPYAALQKEAGLWDWYSRHQLLMTPGAVLFFLGFFQYLQGIFRKITIALTLSTSIVCCLYFAYAWQEDLKSMQALYTCIQKEGLNPDKNTHVIHPGAGFRTALRREIRMYEITAAMMKDSVLQNRLYCIQPPGCPMIIEDFISETYFLRDYTLGVQDTQHIYCP